MKMPEFSLGGFAAFLSSAALAGAEKKATRTALEIGARMIRDEARSALGTYRYQWPQLAQATQDDRVLKGFAANEPGLRTGAMRDSIQYTVLSDEEAEIGSDDDSMVFFELGTVTQPPRPTLTTAAIHKGQDVADIAGFLVGSALAGHSVTEEILKIAGHAMHDLKETAKEVLEGDEENGK
jgi:hypothetical protein